MLIPIRFGNPRRDDQQDRQNRRDRAAGMRK
jgi:hypothetical protein